MGSVHTIEYLELLYWLDRVGYDGYLSLDQYPYREQPEEAITESVLWLQAMRTLVDRMGHERIGEVIRTGDAALAQRLIRQAVMIGLWTTPSLSKGSVCTNTVKKPSRKTQTALLSGLAAFLVNYSGV